MQYWYVLLLAVALMSCNGNSETGNTTTDTGEPWRADQLMEPAALAAMINTNDPNLPLIISIGPSGDIKGTVDMGPAQEEESMKNLEQYLLNLPNDQPLVIYCGCCPFSPCPNIRPAFTLLNQLGYKNHKLLNLSTNLKTDWIDPGYPMKGE